MFPWSSRLLGYAKSDADREVPVPETFHEQTDDELTAAEIKQMEADDQAIQTILLGLPEDIYAAVDSCETAQEICNTKPTTTREFIKTLVIGKLAQPGYEYGSKQKMRMVGSYGGNQFRQYAGQNVGNQNGYNASTECGNQVVQDAVQECGNQNGLIVVSRITNQNPIWEWIVQSAKETGMCVICRLSCECSKGRRGIQLQAEEFVLMADAADLDEKLRKLCGKSMKMAFCWLICSTASTAGSQMASSHLLFQTFVYSRGADILRYSEPTPEPHQVQQNDNVISDIVDNTVRPRRPSPRWSPTGRFFDITGKIIASSESESQSDCSNGYPNLFMFLGTVRFGNDHVAAILGFGDLQWGNILITRVYFVEGLGHNLFSVGQFCDSDLEVAFRRNSCFVRSLEGVDLIDREDIGKLGAKVDIGFFIGLLLIPVLTDSKPGLQGMSFGQISSGLDLTYAPSTITTQKPTEGELDLLFEAMMLTELETQQLWSDNPQQLLDNVPMHCSNENTFVNTFATPSKIAGLCGDVKDTFRGTSGGAQFLGEKLVSWSSKKQDCTALSTAEAEYVSLSACCAQVLWMRTQLTDLWLFNSTRFQSTTDYQLADLFTKALPVDRFNYLVRRLGMRSLSPKELERLAKSQ
ncbi:hypothetical protein Tco_1163864 [Tanacetum coccineum]